MIDLNYKTEDGTRYRIIIEYTYDHKPANNQADPNDSCADESELEMRITNIGHCASDIHHDEIIKDWNNGALYDRAAEKALDDYFGR